MPKDNDNGLVINQQLT